MTAEDTIPVYLQRELDLAHGNIDIASPFCSIVSVERGEHHVNWKPYATTNQMAAVGRDI